MIDLHGKTALVTGGTRGIGRAIVASFLESGATVLYTGTHPEPKEPISGAQYAQLDLLDSGSCSTFIEEIISKFSSLDVLVNNAGININEPINQITDEHWQNILKINLTGAMRMLRAATPKLTASGQGRVVNIASIWAVISKRGRASYSAAKTGLIGLTRAAALDCAENGILINAVAPGFTNTELTARNVSADEQRALAKQVPLGRFAEPKEIAEVVLFLCSPLNTIITGQTIVVDGGFTIQ